MHPREQQCPIREGKVGCHDHDLGSDRAAIGLHPAGRHASKLHCTRPLENNPSPSHERIDEAVQELDRMELGLLVEAQSALGLERQRRALDELDRKPSRAGGLRLGLKQLAFLAVFGVDVIGTSAQLAVDAKLIHEAPDLLQSCFVYGRVGRGRLCPAPLRQPAVFGRLKGAHLCRGVTGGAGANDGLLDQRDIQALRLQGQRRADPADPGAENDRVVGRVRLQRFEPRPAPSVKPR